MLCIERCYPAHTHEPFGHDAVETFFAAVVADRLFAPLDTRARAQESNLARVEVRSSIDRRLTAYCVKLWPGIFVVEHRAGGKERRTRLRLGSARTHGSGVTRQC